MKVGIIGAGAVGGSLGPVWAKAGHDVFFSFSLEPERPKELAEAVGGSYGSAAEAVEFGDVVALTIPYTAVDDAFEAAGPIGDDKILIDCTNPLLPDRSGFSIGHTTSAAEENAKRAPEARVVKAFSTMFQEVMGNKEQFFGSFTPTMFYCGDDEEAKEVVAELIRDTGFEPIDHGPLKQARYLEPFAFVVISLAAQEGWDRDFMMTMLRSGTTVPDSSA